VYEITFLESQNS